MAEENLIDEKKFQIDDKESNLLERLKAMEEEQKEEEDGEDSENSDAR